MSCMLPKKGGLRRDTYKIHIVFSTSARFAGRTFLAPWQQDAGTEVSHRYGILPLLI